MAENTMRAARFHEYGPPEILVIDEVPRPEPGEGEVLIRVYAAGVNPIDWKYRAGNFKAFTTLTLPYTPGFDLAGTVQAVGEGVTGLEPGQAVFGRGSGSYAEYAIAPARALAPKPARISFEQAAAIPIGGITAWMGIFGAGELQAGQRLLVLGAAGGVGSFAVQLGRWKGAQVIGTASPRNLEFVRSLGAAEVIDYTAPAPYPVERDVDVVMDTVGGATTDTGWRFLKPGGILVSAAGTPSEDTAKEHGVRVSGIPPAPEPGEILRQLAVLIQSGDVMAEVGEVFPLDEAARAHALSETGHGRGRIVLRVRE
jgi:NADPH:quinone reductase-like Zn-dependent oxidoreductase